MKKEFKIVTFNIRCFGFDGDYFGKDKKESRLPFLKKFLDENFPDTDLFVLQEIMNPLIVDKFLPSGFNSYTYQHDFSRHMYIVFACKKDFQIKNLQIIADTALDSERSRPALFGTLFSEQKPVLDIIGVHLKSKYEHTENRKKQCQVISKFIENREEDRPLVLTGDFNTHAPDKTFKSLHDIEYLKEIFSDQLTHHPHNNPTYLAAGDHIELDHFFTRGLKIKNIDSYSLYNDSESNPFKKYFNEISDHLPVELTLSL